MFDLPVADPGVPDALVRALPAVAVPHAHLAAGRRDGSGIVWMMAGVHSRHEIGWAVDAIVAATGPRSCSPPVR